MTTAPEVFPTPSRLAEETEVAHRHAVAAAAAGLRDAALGTARLTGATVPLLADAAVTSATPFVRAPLLARISAALLIHPPAGDARSTCPTCAVPAPCETAAVLRR